MKTPSFWYKPPGFLSTLLAPLSLLYAAGRGLDVLTKKPRFMPRTICIGNAVAGGAGKTPTTIALAKLLLGVGIDTQIVTRGYGGSMESVARVKAGDIAAEVGDEPLLLASATTTWVARNRPIGIGCALSAGAQAVLLDDGLQHAKIRAAVNLLVIDGASGFGNGQLLPAGPLREFPSLLARRIDAIILIGADTHHVLAHFPQSIPVFAATIEPDTSALDAMQTYAAFAGLARPEKFFATAEACGLKLAARQAFADHQPYDTATRQKLYSWAQSHQVKLLTTAKDAVRWPADERGELAVLPITLNFANPAAVTNFLREKLDA